MHWLMLLKFFQTTETYMYHINYLEQYTEVISFDGSYK